MKKEKIPDIVKAEAERQGCNYVSYIGTHCDSRVYGGGYVDENGFPLPTGLPILFLMKNNEVTVVEGMDALNLSVKMES